jgi:hypothetical protein
MTLWKDRDHIPASAMRAQREHGHSAGDTHRERPDRGLECGNTQQMKQRRGNFLDTQLMRFSEN